ncbi:hypothetical protein ACP70R_034534 [Stipagrostis hirtigluma subsp. patula]
MAAACQRRRPASAIRPEGSSWWRRWRRFPSPLRPSIGAQWSATRWHGA